MENLASISFSLCLLLLVFPGTEGQQSQCEDLWFGDKCQYQCHCLNDAVCDKITGECPDDCDLEWFGPQCQFKDAAYKSDVMLTDGKDSTCLDGQSLSQDFPMLADVKLTWMRFVTNRPTSFSGLNITFLSSSGAPVVAGSSMTRVYSSENIFDLYGELRDRVKTIRLDFDSAETKQSFCSMRVSLGRNVAIKQNASQSSTYPGGDAEKAVDGKTSQTWDDGTCTATNKESSVYWTLNLSLPVTVNMYTLLSRTDSSEICRLRYFRLESYFESSKVQQYDDTEKQNAYRYNVYPEDTATITSVTLTVSKSFWPNAQYSCISSNPSLSFCEMQIYGDVVCEKGKWGLGCEKDCDCQNPNEECFVSTGLCPSGCRLGFHGPGCQEECSPKFYGVNCATPCSDMCIDQLCNRITGLCDNCPDGKQISINCSEDCALGFYGPRCGLNCSEHCGGDGSCNSINGTCLRGCKPGFRSDYCEEPCTNNTYGDGCSKTCSVNCVVNATEELAICEHVTGQCLLGCLPGSSGITCQEIPSDDSNPAAIVVPIILVLILVAALMFGIWYWRKRRSHQVTKQPRVYDGTKNEQEAGAGQTNNLEMENEPPNDHNSGITYERQLNQI